MNLQVPQVRTLWAAGLGASCAVGLGLFLHAFDFSMGKRLLNLSYDALTVMRGDVPADEAVLVYLDEMSYQELGAPMNVPLDRRWHALLLRRLTAAGARAVAFDMIFNDPMEENPEIDLAFATALRENGTTILGAENVLIGPQMSRFLRPFDLLLTNAAGMGSSEFQADSDLVVRRLTTDDQMVRPLSVAVLNLGEGDTGAVARDTDAQKGEWWISYYGPPGFLPWCRFAEALDPELVGDEFFRGKTVFVGSKLATRGAADRRDEYPSPFSAWLTSDMLGELGTFYTPGVELHATVFLNLMRGEWLMRWGKPLELACLVLIGLASGFGFPLLRPSRAALACLVALTVLLWCSYVLFVQGRIWFPWAIGAVLILFGAGWSIVFNSIQLYAQKRILEHTLGLYLPPKLVQKYARDPKLLHGEGVTQEVTLIFTDIANFTQISNEMDSKKLTAMMNSYFQAAVSKCVHPEDGTVGKFIGDAIFAFWNAPDQQADHRLRACQAALRFREHGMHEFEGRKLVTRIGIHTGVATVGNMGSVERVDYTALGESVNLASRLEGLNKYVGTTCLVSAATAKSLERELTLREVGAFQLKGFAVPVTVFELVGSSEDGNATEEWRTTFADGLRAYRAKDWPRAESAFRRTIEIRGDDGPARFFLERAEELRNATLPEDWAGAIELTEK